MSELLPLNVLRTGDVAEVRQITGSAAQVRRLEELGLGAGVRLEMVRGGSPCIVRVGSSKLCLRSSELLSVIVELRKSA